MEREEIKPNETEITEGDLALSVNSDKANLIKKCHELELTLCKAKERIEILTNLVIKASEEHKRLKAINPHIEQSDYNKSWSWVNKIVFVLKKIDRPLLSHEIIEFITPYEPILQRSHHRPQAFSANLTKALKYHRVRAYKLAGSRGYYYVLPAWMNSDGQLNQEYESKIFFK